MVLSNSKRYLERAKNIIPGLSQTFSKAPYSYVEGIYPVYGSGDKTFTTNKFNREGDCIFCMACEVQCPTQAIKINQL